jgi:ABC-type branched-subunit amino acid transport system ATPase component
MLGSRKVDFKFSLMIYVGVIRPNGSEKTALANSVIVLNFGGKPAEGNPEEVMAKPEVSEACIGSEGERC